MRNVVNNLFLKLRKIDSKQKLTILAFSDYRIHDLGLLENKIDTLNIPIDIILYGGDDTERFIEKDEKGKIIINHFQVLANKSRYGIGVVIGNDCSKKDFRLIKGKRVYDLHRKKIVIGKYLIIGFEGAETNDVNEGIGPTLYKEKYIENKLKSRIKNNKKIILVTHSPPHKTLDFSVRFGKQNIGSKAIRKVIEENDNIMLNICGHSHINGGKDYNLNKCLILNVSNHDGIKGGKFPIGRFCIINIEDMIVKHKWNFVDQEKRGYIKTKSLSEYQ